MNLNLALLMLPGLAIGLTAHEFAHAWVASLLGDGYPRRNKRVTLNPLRHMTPLGTLMILFAPFGWARPVEVNLHNLKHPKRGFVLVSLAGPMANVVVVGVCWLLMHLTQHSSAAGPWGHWPSNTLAILHAVLFGAALLNVILAVVNLLPIPPLDGSKMWLVLMPGKSITAAGKKGAVLIIPLIILMVSGALRPAIDYVTDKVAAVMPVLDRVRYEQHVKLGVEAMGAKDHAAADAHYTMALEMSGHDPMLWVLRSTARFQSGELDASLADAAHALEMIQGRPFAADVRARVERDASVNIHNVHFSRGMAALDSDATLGAAVEHFTKAIHALPASNGAFFMRAAARCRQGRWAEALPDADRAIEIAPENAEYYAQRAEIHAALGNAQRAAADRAKARSLGADIDTPAQSPTAQPPDRG